MTSRELVNATLNFKNTHSRVPRQLWTLPWAEKNCGDALADIVRDYPGDIVTAPNICPDPPSTIGDPYKKGIYIDEWGCCFENINEGIIGEVKKPLIIKDDWSDSDNVRIPFGLLDFDKSIVNKFCRETDRFVMCGGCPRPFERLQFIRTSSELYMDLCDPPPAMLDFMGKMHDYYCRLLTVWAETDVDALFFMDDWGSQRSLLISPDMWVKYFKPMYKDYIDIAHKHGKKIFMHSDGYTLDIIPHLIESGLDAINTQIFCIGINDLRQFAGQITFWGELDRQNLLPYGSFEDIDKAIANVYDNLWRSGGCIAQCEFGIGAKPENVRRMFEKWLSLANDRL